MLPNTDLPDDFALPDRPRWKVIDRSDPTDIAAKLRHVLYSQELDCPLLTRDGIDQLGESLSVRVLPQRSVVSGAL